MSGTRRNSPTDQKVWGSNPYGVTKNVSILHSKAPFQALFCFPPGNVLLEFGIAFHPIQNV